MEHLNQLEHVAPAATNNSSALDFHAVMGGTDNAYKPAKFEPSTAVKEQPAVAKGGAEHTATSPASKEQGSNEHHKAATHAAAGESAHHKGQSEISHAGPKDQMPKEHAHTGHKVEGATKGHAHVKETAKEAAKEAGKEHSKEAGKESAKAEGKEPAKAEGKESAKEAVKKEAPSEAKKEAGSGDAKEAPKAASKDAAGEKPEPAKILPNLSIEDKKH